MGAAVVLPGLLRVAGPGLYEFFPSNLTVAVAAVVTVVGVSALAVYMAASVIAP